MLKRKKTRFLELNNLYLEFCFQKSTIIFFSISLIVFTCLIYLISNPWLDHVLYIEGAEQIERQYLNKAILVSIIINLVLTCFLSIMLNITCLNFDVLFIGHVSRFAITLAKVFVLILLMFFLVLFEWTIIMLIGYFHFSFFSISITKTSEVFFLLIPILLMAILNMIVTELFPIVITPLICLFFELAFVLYFSNQNFLKQQFKDIIPFINVGASGEIELNNYPFFCLIFCLLVIIYICIYIDKDVKNK